MITYLQDASCYLLVAAVVLAVYFLFLYLCKGRRKKSLASRRLVLLYGLGIWLALIFAVTVSPVYGIHWKPDFDDVNLIFGRAWKESGQNQLNLWGNMLMFLPVGAALYLVFKPDVAIKRITGYGFLLSLLIECLQLFLGRGTDVDDLFLNTVGTFAGAFLGKIGSDILWYIGKKKHGHGAESKPFSESQRLHSSSRGKGMLLFRKRMTRGVVALTLVSVILTGICQKIWLTGDGFGGDYTESQQAEAAGKQVTGVSYDKIILNKALSALTLSSKYYYVANVTDGTEMCAKDKDTQIAPASTAKMATALTVIKYCSLDEVVTVGEEVNRIAADASRAGLIKGNRLTVGQLLEGMLLPSGNDAAYTLAVHTGRKIAGTDQLSTDKALSIFMKKMNDTAEEAGAKNSSFSRPDGYDEQNQYSTVYDLACIATAFMNSTFEKGFLRETVMRPKIREVFTDGTDVTWQNTNELLAKESSYYYKNATGLKTGSSDLAGKCLVSTAEIGRKEYICIVMADTDEGRYEDTLKIYKALEKQK